MDGGLFLVANSIGGASEMDAINQVVWAARISKSPSSSPASASVHPPENVSSEEMETFIAISGYLYMFKYGRHGDTIC